MRLPFKEYLKLGHERWPLFQNPLASLFIKYFGSLGIHSKIRNAKVLNILLNLNLELDNKEILDVGCGDGYLLFWLNRHFPNSTYTGLEIDRTKLANCNYLARYFHKNNFNFFEGPLSELGPPPTYDLVISIDVLEHVPDDEAMLQHFAKVLKPAGLLLLHLPLRHQLQKRIFPNFKKHVVSDHLRDEYLPEEIKDKAQRAGFSILERGYGFGFWGEFSFELNNFFWKAKRVKTLFSLLTYPFSLIFGYIDIISHPSTGNSIYLILKKS